MSAQPCSCTLLSQNWGMRSYGSSSPNLTLTAVCLHRFAFTDTHSLSYNFTIDPQPRPRQPWCEVQGQVDGELYLSYDCGHAKIIFTSPLGEVKL